MANVKDFDYLQACLTAPIYDLVKETPLQLATNLSQTLTTLYSESKNIKVLLKREDLQPVFSFKLRGAYNKLLSLDVDSRSKGVIAVSAGNHAQGVAMAAQKLNIPATIVMPLATPAIKWKNVKRMGATVILKGNDFDEAKLEGQRLVAEQGLTDIPPYDDPYIIAGQATAGVEILRQCGDLEDIEAIFCCVGGGGLAAGISNYVKRIQPNIKVFGVETTDSFAMTHSLRKGFREMVDQVGLFADGAAVRLVGKETFRLCELNLDGMILVNNDDICAAIKDIFEDTRSVVEPAGALGVAGLKKWLSLNSQPNVSFIKENGLCQSDFYWFENQNVLLSNQYLANQSKESKGSYVALLSGANMNFDRLRFVADRADIGLAKEAFISVVVPETPGSFIKLHNLILPRNVTSFAYRYSNSTNGYIFLSFTLTNPNDRDNEIKQLFLELESTEGFNHPMDLSDNELAKTHARFLVGGRSDVPNERLYRFEFPERPDALSKFLAGLKFGWNVSLFHYRNYGGDTGKVLVGIQIPPKDLDSFNEFLMNLNYPWVDETDNLVYKVFLKS